MGSQKRWNEINIRKHGITFEQALYVFSDPYSLNKYDEEHSEQEEYDFSGAEQGKFYRPIEDLDITIYLDKEVKAFFIERLKAKGQEFSLNQTINSLLKKDIEILNQLGPVKTARLPLRSRSHRRQRRRHPLSDHPRWLLATDRPGPGRSTAAAKQPRPGARSRSVASQRNRLAADGCGDGVIIAQRVFELVNRPRICLAELEAIRRRCLKVLVVVFNVKC